MVFSIIPNTDKINEKICPKKAEHAVIMKIFVQNALKICDCMLVSLGCIVSIAAQHTAKYKKIKRRMKMKNKTEIMAKYMKGVA